MAGESNETGGTTAPARRLVSIRWVVTGVVVAPLVLTSVLLLTLAAMLGRRVV
jgi:hypothetical protein